MHNQSTKLLTVGGVALGGGSGVKIQSMTTTKTADVEKTVAQILALEKAGCEIVRVAIADYLRKTHGAEADPDLLYLTVGAAAALTISLSAVLPPPLSRTSTMTPSRP